MTTPEQQDSAPEVGEATEVDAAELDVHADADDDVPATSDPEAYVDDPTLGGTGGRSTGGAG